VLEPATITLYTSEPQEKADELVAAFNEIHPEITVEVFRAGTGDLTTRVATERESGAVQADVFLAADAGTFEDYAAEDLLLPYTPADVEALNPDVVDPEGYYTGTRIIPTVIAYNTGMITDAPTSWEELTDAAYADQIVMPNPDVSGAAAYNAAVWLDEPSLGEEWMTALAENRPVIADSNGPVSQAVATGAQPVGIVVDYLLRELAAQGSPIAVSYPSEGVPYVSQPVGIFADTDEAEASQAFVDFLVSAAGQELAVAQSYLPVRSDVGTPEGAPSMDEITILSPDLETIRSTQDAAVETFRGLFL
jgi:iron(III) transport system substrate-binding protein